MPPPTAADTVFARPSLRTCETSEERGGATHSAARRELLRVCRCRGIDIDSVRDVQVVLGLLLERVARDGLERLLHVDRLLGRRLKIGDVALGLAPC